MRVRGRHEIRLGPININSGFCAPVQSSVWPCLLQQTWALYLSSKSQDTIILVKSFYQSLKERSVFSISITEIWSFWLNCSEKFNQAIAWCYEIPRILLWRDKHCSISSTSVVFPWCTLWLCARCLCVFLLSWKAKVQLWIGEGKW